MSWVHDDPEGWLKVNREALVQCWAESYIKYFNHWGLTVESIRPAINNTVSWLQDEWETVFTAAVLAIPQSYIDRASEDYLADREAEAINAMEIYNQGREL